MRMEKEFAGQFFSFISSLIDPRVGRLKKKKKGRNLFKRNACTNIILARLINDRRAYQRAGILARGSPSRD